MTDARYKKSNRHRSFAVPTAESLAKAALRYVERYAASEASFRRVLQNRIRRAAMSIPAFAGDRQAQEKLAQDIERLVQSYREKGILNDKAFAEMKAGSLRRSGQSQRRIAQKLQQKGVASPLIAQALDAVDAEGENEQAAAHRFAKKRAIGPYRRPSSGLEKNDPGKRDKKELAAMLRAGFSYDIVREILKTQIETFE